MATLTKSQQTLLSLTPAQKDYILSNFDKLLHLTMQAYLEKAESQKAEADSMPVYNISLKKLSTKSVSFKDL